MTRARAIPVTIGVIVAIVAAVVVAITVASRPPAATSSAEGVVIRVDAEGLTEVRGFAIRTLDGAVIEFRVGSLENGAEFPPSHLAEHRATARPVLVLYRVENGERVAYRIEDAG